MVWRMNEIRFIDMFCGIGGFRLGLEKANKENTSRQAPAGCDLRCVGNSPHNTARNTRKHSSPIEDNSFRCVWANDNDKYACQIYRKHWGDRELYEGGIRAVDADAIPEHDLLCAGFPCQSFSIAGKRGGFEDTRGTLFFEICRVIRAKRPGYLLLENVKGLLSHDDGNTFETIIGTLDELGYDCQWQVLNSKDYGVPQNRERVFIVGHTRGKPRPKVFPIGEDGEGDGEDSGKGARNGERLATALDSNYWKGIDGKRTMVAITDSGLHREKQIRTDILPPLRAGRGCDRQDTVQIADFVANKIRRLTPLECERLQSFPDGWTNYGLSSIMEICVKLSDAIEKQLQLSDIALCTTKGGSTMELRSYPSELKSDVSIAVDRPLPVNYVIDTINPGRDMVMLYNQKEILNTVEEIKANLILDKMDEKSKKKLLNLYLEGSWNEEKLSTILTLIKETIANPISMFAKIDKNIIGVIIHLKKLGVHYSNKASLGLRMANILSISDTQRYKCLGNAVTVNVIEAIGRQFIEGLNV